MGQGDGLLLSPYSQPSAEWSRVLSSGLSAMAVSSFVSNSKESVPSQLENQNQKSGFESKTHFLESEPEGANGEEFLSCEVSNLSRQESVGCTPLERLSSDEVPRLSFVGGAMAGLLKMLVRQKMMYVGQCQVAIGGDSRQLIRGEAESFRIYLKDFCFRGLRTTEAEAHTLEGGIRFSLSSAASGGRFFCRKVPMLLSVRESEEDGNASLHTNNLLRKTLQECWNYMHGVSVQEFLVDDGPDASPDFPLPLPQLKMRLGKGLALFEETRSENSVKSSLEEESNPQMKKFALHFQIENVGQSEELVVSTADWPKWAEKEGREEGEWNERIELRCDRPRWRKVIQMSEDIRFQSFSVHKGWFSYSYKFELDV